MSEITYKMTEDHYHVKAKTGMASSRAFLSGKMLAEIQDPQDHFEFLSGYISASFIRFANCPSFAESMANILISSTGFMLDGMYKKIRENLKDNEEDHKEYLSAQKEYLESFGELISSGLLSKFSRMMKKKYDLDIMEIDVPDVNKETREFAFSLLNKEQAE